MRVGFQQDPQFRDAGLFEASGRAIDDMWFVTTTSVDRIVGIFDAEKRKEISGVVGLLRGHAADDPARHPPALLVLAMISLSLGVINLFPFLPLDGGHIFWAVVEKIRRKPVSFSVMERAGFIGFALVLMLFVVGLHERPRPAGGRGFPEAPA